MLFANSTKKLYIALGIVILITAVVLVINFSGKSNSSGNDKGLPTFDTTKVSKLVMIPKGSKSEVVFYKKNGDWTVKLPSPKGKVVEVSTQKMENIVFLLANFTIINLVSREKGSTSNFGLDTGFTSVKLYSGEEAVLDLKIGKGEMISEQETGSYICVVGSDDVYLVSGFLDRVFNSDLSLYRNSLLTFGGTESWAEVKFSGAENFVMKRKVTDWEIDGKLLDSTKVTDYLTGLSELQGRNFADDIQLSAKEKPSHQVEVKTTSGRQFVLSGYIISKDTLITSSLSKGTVFRNSVDSPLYQNIFLGRKGLE
jgi:hypothetical protein